MPWLDIILAIPLIWGMYRGFRNGFIIELCTLMALVLGVYAASLFGESAGEYLVREFNTEARFTRVAAFALVFMFVVAAMWLLGKMLTAALKMAALGTLNKLAGLVFGLMKYAILWSTTIYISEGFTGGDGLFSDAWVKDSYLYEGVHGLAPALYPMLKQPGLIESLLEETRTM